MQTYKYEYVALNKSVTYLGMHEYSTCTVYIIDKDITNQKLHMFFMCSVGVSWVSTINVQYDTKVH